MCCCFLLFGVNVVGEVVVLVQVEKVGEYEGRCCDLCFISLLVAIVLLFFLLMRHLTQAQAKN
jgi:hypothetical protein